MGDQRQIKQPTGTTRLVVFAREPLLGAVKSRLAVEIGEPSALAVYEAMLARTAALAENSMLGEWDLWVTSNPDHERFLSICNCENIHIQMGSDLGAKMDHSIQQTLSQHATQNVILIGTDCPALTQNYLQQAAFALSSGADVVLGPAEDGGYVLIGANRPIPTLFEGVQWGSEQVLQQTLSRLKNAQISYQLLDTLWDVDRPDDLKRTMQLNPPLAWDSKGGQKV